MYIAHKRVVTSVLNKINQVMTRWTKDFWLTLQQHLDASYWKEVHRSCVFTLNVNMLSLALATTNLNPESQTCFVPFVPTALNELVWQHNCWNMYSELASCNSTCSLKTPLPSSFLSPPRLLSLTLTHHQGDFDIIFLFSYWVVASFSHCVFESEVWCSQLDNVMLAGSCGRQLLFCTSS